MRGSLSLLGLAALELAVEHGFAVFPLRPRGKRPITSNGFHDATSNSDQIGEWWDRWPTANIGLYPGAAALIVIDIDGPTGEATARAAGAYNVPTLEAVTQRGVHRYFRLPVGVRIGNLARTELDIRAHAGYVLAPPSVHPSGHVYTWRGEMDAIAPAPQRLLEAILRKRREIVVLQSRSAHRGVDARAARRVLAYAAKLGYGYSDGRKTAAYRFSAFLAHDVALTVSDSLAFLATWNSCNLPPLSQRGLAAIHENARRYGGPRGVA